MGYGVMPSVRCCETRKYQVKVHSTSTNPRPYTKAVWHCLTGPVEHGLDSIHNKSRNPLDLSGYNARETYLMPAQIF
jgi:hypothetical protein